MQKTADSRRFGVTQLTAINTAKVLTILLLVAFALVFGIQDLRQVLYLSQYFSVAVPLLRLLLDSTNCV